jgi:virulence-associated protein VagC
MKTKVIKSGNSQAVRIPAAFRLKGSEVEIEQQGGLLVIFDPKERARRRKALRKLWKLPPMAEEWPRP